MAFKKKLYKWRPSDAITLEVHQTKTRKTPVSANPLALERHVRQMLADKISGTHVGLWLLLPEYLRLGVWDLLTAWTGAPAPAVAPRLALQIINEAALCVTGVRERRALRHKGFETLNGLHGVATDTAIHQLLEQHTVADAGALQTALAFMRSQRGHYPGPLVLLDPHRIPTWTMRQMPLKKYRETHKPCKVLQTFFAIDAISGQPLGCDLGSATVTVTQATQHLLDRITPVLPPDALLVADREHFTVDLLKRLQHHPTCTFLIPMPHYSSLMQNLTSLPFTPLWAGYAVAESTYHLAGLQTPLRLIVQRTGERPRNYSYTPFVTSSSLPAQHLMTILFPERWNIEEFFNTEQALGWQRARTWNLHIRSNKLALALMAQAAIYQLRQHLPPEMANWSIAQLAQHLFAGIDGDLRVAHDTILVTLYNAPRDQSFQACYEHLPKLLESEGVDPHVPWLYNLKVDFRFK